MLSLLEALGSFFWFANQRHVNQIVYSVKQVGFEQALMGDVDLSDFQIQSCTNIFKF